MTHKIAIDLTAYTPSRMDGINRYSFEILKALLNTNLDFLVYTSHPILPNKRIKVIANPEMSDNNFQGNITRLFWHQFQLPQYLKQDKISLLYTPVPEGMFFPVCPQIITVHDLLPIFFPEVYPRIKYYFQYILPYLLKSATAIIAVSQSTKNDLQKYYNIPSDLIHVVYPGYNSDNFNSILTPEANNIPAKYKLQNFILCVGETRPYKNTRRLIYAFSQLNFPDLTLAIVGKLSKMDKELISLPKELNIVDKVSFLGEVTDEELAGLYHTAKAFVFPSLYEGFGIPPLEAMACGCPVVTSRVASLPEVCGDAVYYVNPEDINSITEGIYQVLTDINLAAKLRNQGLERVKQFDYQITASRIKEIISINSNVNF
ncbi:MAG: glycosyltransferase family 4 protein [Gomphosphaeria aponina SAG 52.96 = DSM 107014]|uniref:Glycosyltransferase family 4 protein n=1 Tax=Gomphosphaeria aponina SAG 52.96 = DSM 107014 TaxID=1521640 RepID=A0A941JQF3_9CHRO|nr:glycosyltransferase family 4 protein [Gomphosphaeria aponina SAG 52.96 = DSM 107014]